MKELEISQTFIKFDPKPPADAKPGEEVSTDVLPGESEGEETPKPQPTTVEIVDMKLDVVLGRRHEHIMNRTMRIRTAYTKDSVGLSNSHRITF